MAHKLFLFILLAIGTSNAAFSASENSYAQARLIEQTRMSGLVVAVAPLPGIAIYQLTATDPETATEVRVVFHDGELQKAIDLAAADFKQRAAMINQFDHGNPSLAIQSHIMVSFGVPLQISTWIELPTSISEGADRWMRTQVSFDGVLNGPNPRTDSSVLVSRLALTVWQRSVQRSGLVAVVKLGTLEASMRSEPAMIATQRIDLSVASAGVSQIFGEMSNFVRPFYNATLSAGLRLVDQSYAVLRFHMQGEVRLGIVFANQFFLAAKAAGDSDFHSHGHTALGVEGYWQASSLVGLKAGVDYSMPAPDVSYDPMYVVPRGWNFSSGFNFRY